MRSPLNTKLWVDVLYWNTKEVERHQKYIRQLISLLKETDRLCCLQQDGTTTHTIHYTVALLEELFRDWIVENNLWPSQSPDLQFAGFFSIGLIVGEHAWKQPSHHPKIQTVRSKLYKQCLCVLFLPQETRHKEWIYVIMKEKVKFKIFCEHLRVARVLKPEVKIYLVDCDILGSCYMHKFIQFKTPVTFSLLAVEYDEILTYSLLESDRQFLLQRLK